MSTTRQAGCLQSIRPWLTGWPPPLGAPCRVVGGGRGPGEGHLVALPHVLLQVEILA